MQKEHIFAQQFFLTLRVALAAKQHHLLGFFFSSQTLFHKLDVFFSKICARTKNTLRTCVQFQCYSIVFFFENNPTFFSDTELEPNTSNIITKHYCFNYSELIALEYLNFTDTDPGPADNRSKPNHLLFLEPYVRAHVHDDVTTLQAHEKKFHLPAHAHEFDTQSS